MNKNIDRGLNWGTFEHSSIYAHVSGCSGEKRNLQEPFPASLPSSWMFPTDVETLVYGNGAWKERICFWVCLAGLFGYLSSEGLPEQKQGSWALSGHLRPSTCTDTVPLPQCQPTGSAHGLGSSFVPLLWVRDEGEGRAFQFLFWMVCRDEHLRLFHLRMLWPSCSEIVLLFVRPVHVIHFLRTRLFDPPQTCLAQDLWHISMKWDIPRHEYRRIS